MDGDKQVTTNPLFIYFMILKTFPKISQQPFVKSQNLRYPYVILFSLVRKCHLVLVPHIQYCFFFFVERIQYCCLHNYILFKKKIKMEYINNDIGDPSV